MFHIEDVLTLKPDERVKTVARCHVVTLVPKLFFALLLIVVPFFLLFPLFNWGMPGIVVFLIAVAAGIILAIRTLILWDAGALVVTTSRIVHVDQRGVFTRMVSEAPFSSIQDVSWSMKGFWSSLARMGTVRIRLSSGATTIEATRVSHPETLHRLISEMRGAGVGSRASGVVATGEQRPAMPSVPATPSAAPSTTSGSPERIERILAVLKTYSDEELARIEAVLKARER